MILVLAVDELQKRELNSIALVTNEIAVEIVEVSRLALVESGLIAQGKSTIVDGPASCIDGARLRWRPVKLELLVRDNSTNATMGVSQERVRQSHIQEAGALARLGQGGLGRLGRGGNLRGSSGSIARGIAEHFDRETQSARIVGRGRSRHRAVGGQRAPRRLNGRRVYAKTGCGGGDRRGRA